LQKIILLTVLTLVLSASIANANIVANGSFESPTGLASWTTVTPDNWTGSNVDLINGYYPAEDGKQCLDLNALVPGSIEQTLTTVSGNWYEISFWMAANAAGGPDPKTLDVSWGNDTMSFSHPQDQTWTNFKWNVKAIANTTVLKFASTTIADSGNGSYPHAFGPALDNVSVNAVPEPGTILASLSILAPAGLMFRRRKRA